MPRLCIIVSDKIYDKLIKRTKKYDQSQAEIVRAALVSELGRGDNDRKDEG